jgi:hypothetical protein
MAHVTPLDRFICCPIWVEAMRHFDAFIKALLSAFKLRRLQLRQCSSLCVVCLEADERSFCTRLLRKVQSSGRITSIEGNKAGLGELFCFSIYTPRSRLPPRVNGHGSRLDWNLCRKAVIGLCTVVSYKHWL